MSPLSTVAKLKASSAFLVASHQDSRCDSWWLATKDAILAGMPSAHDEAETHLNVRVLRTLKKNALNELWNRGLQVRPFVIACLTLLAKSPVVFLEILEPHWPDRKAYRGGQAAVNRIRAEKAAAALSAASTQDEAASR
uniref:hypothetical protein n=1 Tax=Amycolatopsis sp. CA-096443 TaxID=3239919 RepID=UPI003F49551D